MLVIIKKDDATSVSREVADIAEARSLALGGLPVFIQNEDGSTTPVTAEDVPEEAPQADSGQGGEQQPADDSAAG